MAQVRRRCVFYVSGFDPKGAAHYHALYTQQAALQAPINGLALQVGPRRRPPGGNSFWEVSAQSAGEPVHVHYEFLRWDDVVRDHWPRKRTRLAADIFVATLFNIRHGSLWKMFKLSWPPALALFLPFVSLCMALVGAPVAGALAAWALHALGAQTGPAIALGLGVSLSLEAMLLKLEASYSMGWLMRSYAFTARQALGRIPDLESRLDALAARVAQRIGEGRDDEILVVGHSTGANMAVTILARALAACPPADGAASLALLTLGQCIPLMGVLPQAEVFRNELARVAACEQLTWIDFSAPPDGSCFALTDPLAACGLARPVNAAKRPKLLSPRFAEMFDAGDYLRLRKNKLRMHFQYLMASAKAVEFDYFLITAGPALLGERFASLAGVENYDALQPFAPRHAT